MKDGDAQLWLTDKERAAWTAAESIVADDYTAYALWDALRALAVTRCAMAAHEGRGDTPGDCVLCGRYLCGADGCNDDAHGHDADCVFATMPRPK